MTEQLTKTSTNFETQLSKPIYNNSYSKINSGLIKELKGIPTENYLYKLSIICITFLASLLIICSAVIEYKKANINCINITNKV